MQARFVMLRVRPNGDRLDSVFVQIIRIFRVFVCLLCILCCMWLQDGKRLAVECLFGKNFDKHLRELDERFVILDALASFLLARVGL